jgi:beta-lactamase class A
MRPLSILAIVVVLFSCNQKRDIKKELTDTLNVAKGNFALAFKDLQTGEEILINEHQLFHAASTMKTPVMIEVFKQARSGNFSMGDSIEIRTTFNSIVDSTFSLSADDDSEHELYTIVGQKRPVSELVYKMIILSSNLATNILIDLVGAKNVTQSMRDIGAKDIQVLRGVEDGKAFRAGLNNKVTAYDLMLVFDAIKDEKEMIDILLDQKFNEIIPSKLPKEVKVAHKTGWITGLHHDSALVILPDGRRYILVLLSDSLTDENAGVRQMATASKMIYDYVNR